MFCYAQHDKGELNCHIIAKSKGNNIDITQTSRAILNRVKDSAKSLVKSQREIHRVAQNDNIAVSKS